MKIKKGFILREVGGENVVVPVGERSKDFHGMIQLNKTGAFLWRFYENDHTKEEGISAICAEFNVEESVAASGVENFLSALEKNNFLE